MRLGEHCFTIFKQRSKLCQKNDNNLKKYINNMVIKKYNK